MKIKALQHDPEEYNRVKKGEMQKVIRNSDPSLHPFDRAREYKRALNAVKLDKIFAKPLLCALEGHRDSILSLIRSHRHLPQIFTSSADGEIRHWNIATKQCTKAVRAHTGFARCLALSHDDHFLFSGGDDGLIKQWRLESNSRLQNLQLDDLEDTGHLIDSHSSSTALLALDLPPLHTLRSSPLSSIRSLDHSRLSHSLCSISDVVQIWDVQQGVPVHTFEAHEVTSLLASRFSPSEPNLLAVTSSSNLVALYDIRQKSTLRKVLMKNRCNALSWNPQEPVTFAVANEDSNIYTYDMRNLSKASGVCKDFISAVLDVDYSPDGQTIVGGSYDGTIRMWKKGEMKSLNVYHTRRMGRVHGVRFSGDCRFVVSGSDDGNVRVWKKNASEKLGPLTRREKEATEYRDALKKKFQYVPEVRRIARHQHVPSLIKSQQEKRKVQKEAQFKKAENVKRHGGNKGAETEKQKPVYKEIE